MTNFQLNKAIDIHSHFNHGVEGDTITSELYITDLDFLKKERKRLNIVAMAACSFSSVITDKFVYEENDYYNNICQNDEFFYQWVVIDPRNKKTYQQALKLINSKKVLGLKIHSSSHKYEIMDYIDEILSFADKNHQIVLMHPDHIEEVAKKMDDYPNVKLIIAHIGSIEHINAIKNAKYGNIYTDTSGIASSRNNIMEYAVSQIGSEKIFFGTDTYSSAFQLGRILFADISEKDKENILFNNAKRVFSDNFNNL